MAEDGYYGYVEGEASNQINWAEIGKNMSDMLVTQKRVREEKRVAIDDASRELGEELANAPTGTYDAGNDFVLGYAQNAQEYRMMADRLLKSGQMKLKDYMVGRANINSDTETLFSLAKEYQVEFAEKMERYDNDKSAFLEVWEMEQVEGMANLNGITAIPNPTNGIVTLLNKDGSTMTANGMRSRLKNRYDRFDIQGETAKVVEALGVDIRMMDKDDNLDVKWEKGVGAWLTTEATQTEKGNYIGMENDEIASMLANPYDAASVLVDHTDNNYTFVNKADLKGKKAKANEIVIDYTQPVSLRVQLTEDQEIDAKEAIRKQIRTKIDSKVTAQFNNQQYSPERKAKAAATVQAGLDFDKQLNFAQNIGSLYGGSAQEIKVSESAIRAINPSIKRLDRNNKGVTILYNNGESEPIEFTQDGKPLTENQFIESMYNFVAPTIDGKTLSVTDFKKLAEKGMSKEREFMLLGEGEMISDSSETSSVGPKVEKIVSDIQNTTGVMSGTPLSNALQALVKIAVTGVDMDAIEKNRVTQKTKDQIDDLFLDKNVQTKKLSNNRIEVTLPGKESIYLDLSDNDNLSVEMSKLATYIKSSEKSSGSSNTVNYGEK
jgi:hypothetical protein